MDTEARGKRRTDFAAFAEALKITTDSVMSVQSDDGGRTFTVLYTATPTADPTATLYRAILWTNIEGILEVVQAAPLTTVGRFAAQVRLIMAGVERPLNESERKRFLQ